MAINLKKGQRIDIGLNNLTIGLGWDPNEGTGSDFDLDASAFMIDQNRLIPKEDFFIFYGNSDGDDDESIEINLSKVDGSIEEILFVVTIHDAENRKQNFGQVRNSYIRIVNNENNEEIAKYELEEDFSVETAIEFGRLYRKNGSWKFEASGVGYQKDLSFFVEKHYKGNIIK